LCGGMPVEKIGHAAVCVSRRYVIDGFFKMGENPCLNPAVRRIPFFQTLENRAEIFKKEMTNA
jgi:hypothetical protein